MAGLTAAALAAVAFLAYQASAAADRVPDDGPEARKSASASPGGDGGTDDARPGRPPLPAGSGDGERVVYALDAQRVWLVGTGEQVTRTYRVWPSSVSPPPGEYRVSSRSARVTGSDGVPVENVVRFASVDGTTVGFSAALDGSRPDPEPGERTGGVRQRRADGEAMWLFADVGTTVVVVP